MGPDLIAGGFGPTPVPPERFGLVLAVIKARSAAAPYEYEWAPATLGADLVAAETAGAGYGGFRTADGLYQTPAVDPTDPDGVDPWEEDDVVFLQWDEASRTYLIVGADGRTAVEVGEPFCGSGSGCSGESAGSGGLEDWWRLEPDVATLTLAQAERIWFWDANA
jgi:hypothetical protein